MQQLYYNGTILTMERPLYAQAVLVEEGRILSVGNLEELTGQAKPGTERIDLEGHTLLPAFIDSHSHFSAVATGLLQLSLEDCASFQEVENAIRAFITGRKLAKGAWILARGYDHNHLKEGRHPSLPLLDRAAPYNPLVLQHQSGHMGVFNSAALEELGVHPDTPVPSGGRIGQENGALTGYMEENAFLEYLKRVPLPSVEALLDAYQEAQQLYASYGITTVQEGMLTQQLVELYQALLHSGRLQLDVVGYLDAACRQPLLDAFGEHLGRYHKHFKVGGYKIFLDGSPQSRTAWMRLPYVGEESYRGYNTLTDGQVEAYVRQAVQDGMQLLAHCNGDAACEQYLTAVKKVAGELGRSETAAIRPVMIHAQLLGIDQLELVRELSVIPSFFIAHIYHWGDIHLRNFGPERAEKISPANAALHRGIPFTFHQDAPVIAPDMLETVWCAVERTTKDGVTLGQEERIDVLDALRAVTVHSAYQYFEEGEKGSIVPGKRADFVILDRNPLEVERKMLRDIQVLETIREGKSIYHR